MRFLLFFCLLISVSCSTGTRQLFFDIPPPNKEKLAEQARLQAELEAVDLPEQEDNQFSMFQALDNNQPRPEIESLNSWEDVLEILPKDYKKKADWSAALEQGSDASAQLWVRINPLDSGLAEADLTEIIGARPYGVMVPKTESGADIAKLASMLEAEEAAQNVQTGSTRIGAIATETGAEPGGKPLEEGFLDDLGFALEEALESDEVAALTLGRGGDARYGECFATAGRG